MSKVKTFWESDLSKWERRMGVRPLHTLPFTGPDARVPGGPVLFNMGRMTPMEESQEPKGPFPELDTIPRSILESHREHPNWHPVSLVDRIKVYVPVIQVVAAPIAFIAFFILTIMASRQG